MNSAITGALIDHLWQSTVFVAVMGGLTLLVRRNSARVRYLMWLAASIKFLIPFALLSAAGTSISWILGSVHWLGSALDSAPAHQVARLSRAGSEGVTTLGGGTAPAAYWAGLLNVCALIWLLGTCAVCRQWYSRWQVVRAALRDSVPANLAFVLPVRFSSFHFEPAVVGVLDPVLLLPEGLERRLSPPELRAVLAHERAHVAWKDNPAAMLHMCVEALFWFHPLVWWLGARILDERERACDERVIAQGHAPAIYAEGILKVCEHCLGVGLECVAGIGGARLILRVEQIMHNSGVARLGMGRKLAISLVACLSIVLPIAAGVLTVQQAKAQGRANSSPSNPVLEGPVLAGIHFENANIGQIAEAVAKATHMTFVIDPRAARESSISFELTGPVTPAQFYGVFLSILRQHHLVAIPTGQGIKIIPDEGIDQRSPASSTNLLPVSVRNSAPAFFLGPPRDWELRDEVWLPMPDPATQSRQR